MSQSEIASRFTEVCRDRSSALAVRDLADHSALTFADLFEQHEVLCRALRREGLGPGSLLVSLLGNRPIFFPLVVACFETGLTLLPLGETTPAEVVALVERSGAAAIVTERRLPFATRGETPLFGGARLIRLDPRDSSLARRQAAVLKLTSGSTEQPRAAIAEEAHLVNDGRHVIEAMTIGPEDVNVAYIPLSHSYALGNIVMPLVWQGTGVAVCPSFAPVRFRADVESAGATVFAGVPFMFERLAALTQATLPSTLRLLISAGAPIGIHTVRWFSERLSRKIHSFYGSSETGGITYDASDEVEDRVHVGTPMPETTVTIRDGDGGEDGRVFVTGNAVTAGYAGATDISTGFADGGFLLTDLGHMDDVGRLMLTGRASPLVNVAGRKVDPAEVERVLRTLPAIADVRVLGAACDHRGQQLAAVVVRRNRTLTAAAIRQQCSTMLSAYKIPRRFVFLDELPVDARGKVDRRTLEALVAAEGD